MLKFGNNDSNYIVIQLKGLSKWLQA